MLGRQPAAAADDVPCPKYDDVPRPKPEADNTTRSADVPRFPTVASLGRRATGLAARPRVTVMNRDCIDDEQWNDMSDAKLLARDRAAMIRMRRKRTRIIATQPDQGKATLKPKPVGEQTDIQRQPADEHADLIRWKEDEQKHFEQEEKKRLVEAVKRMAENQKAVLQKLAELEQQEKQRSEDNGKAHLDRIAEIDQRVAKKADKEQVDHQARDLASVRPHIDKVEEDALSLQTQLKGLSEKVDLVERSQGPMKTAIDANTQSNLETRGRVHVLENPLHVRQVNITNLGAIATAIAADEQPQSNTDGCDPKEVSALTAKTDGHDQRIERLETTMGDVVPKMEKASPWFDRVGGELETHAQYFSEHRDIPDKVKEIEAAHERQGKILDEALAKQKESFEEKLRQQKEASDKEKQELKESMQEQMRLSEAFIRKECEERLASKDKEFAEHFAKAEAERKEQNERQNQMENKMNDFIAMMQAQNATQQLPAPVQGQQQPPQALPPQPTPAPQGNGRWTATPAPPNQGPQPVPRPEVNMGAIPDLDDEMKDAPPEPPQQQPFSQPPRQPSQPNFATPDDTPMTSGEPMIPNNTGNLGFGPKPQPMGSKQPFAGPGPLQPAPSARPTPTVKHGNQLQRSLFAPGAPPPAVNKPQINWSASAGNLDFDPPAGMDIDDDDDVKPSQPKARQPLVNAAPATPWAGKPAANNAPSRDTVMTNGPSSTAGGPPSTPAKPQAPAPTKPKPAKKKADPMVRRKPGATPSKPVQTTNKAQTTQTKMASFAEKRQAAFAASYGSTPAPKITVEKTVLPSVEPPEEPTEFNIPGLTGAVNTSPFAMKPKAPAPVPKPTPSPAFTPVVAGSNNLPPAFVPTSPVSYRPASPVPGPTSPIYSPTSPAFNHTASTPKPHTSSPLANPAATSDTIESATTTNVFSKELEKPVEKPSEGEAAATKPPKYETDVNRRKHAAAVQIVPNDDAKIHRRESQDDAKSHKPEGDAKDPEGDSGDSRDDSMADKEQSQGSEPMQTDRPVAKPKSKASKLTAAEKKQYQDDFNQQSAWDEMDKAFAHEGAQAVKAAAAAGDDEVDYADPNDINDEDVHITTMVPPTPTVRPTKYTVDFFKEWKAHFLSEENLIIQASKYGCESKEDFALFIEKVRKQDKDTCLDFLVEQAKVPMGRQAYSKTDMVRICGSFCEEVFIQAITTLDLDDLDRGLMQTRGRFMIYVNHWLLHHKPDAV